MAVYALTTFATGKLADPKAALDALKTELDGKDTGKNIRYIDVIREGATFTGVVIYDT